jgi:hypothetical protein
VFTWTNLYLSTLMKYLVYVICKEKDFI